MSRIPDPPEGPSEPEWSPATSRPGEMYTVEGRIRAAGTIARGLKDRDPRGRAYRRSMRRVALWCMGAIVAIVALAALATALG